MQIVTNIALISINETLVIQLVSFLLFVFIINRVMFRPLRSTVADRERYISRLRQDVTDAKKEMDDIGKKIVKAEERARKEAFEQQEKMKTEGSRKADAIYEEARKEIGRVKMEAETHIQNQITQARRHLESESRALALVIMEKVLNRRLNP